jgi:opacity protein-like surface antigen
MGRAGQFGAEFGYVTGADLKGTLPGRLNPTINGVPATGAFTGTVRAHILRATPEFRFGPLIKAGSVKIMPYVTGGGGFYWTRYNDDELNFGGSNASLSSLNDYNGGWNAGGGLEVSLSPALGIGADIRYHDIIYNSGPDTTYLLPEGKLILYF